MQLPVSRKPIRDDPEIPTHGLTRCCSLLTISEATRISAQLVAYVNSSVPALRSGLISQYFSQ